MTGRKARRPSSSSSSRATSGGRSARASPQTLLSSDEDVHRLDDRRALVTDAHGVRYLTALDATSRRLLERFL